MYEINYLKTNLPCFANITTKLAHISRNPHPLLHQ